MAEIYYNGDVVNSTVSGLTSISNELSSLSSGLCAAANQIVSAKGFNEYVGGLSSDTFSGYVDQCNSYITGLSDFIRNQQVRILAYNDDKDEINAFLSSLNRNEYKRLDLTPISSYITDLAGGLNNYTPPANGWISVQVDNSSVNNYIRCAYDVIMVKSSGNGQASALSCLIPVIANTKVGIRAVCTTLAYAYFIPCQGNV